MKRLTALCLLGLLPWSLASADLPYTFKAGDPIRASELNANFQYLDSLAAAGSEGPLVRRKATLRASSFTDVVTVPDTATNGWVLRSYVTGCGNPILRIDSDPSFPMTPDARLVVRAGETLQAKCTESTTSTVGYFMFDEQ
jgi:hypothetical protein